MYDPDSFDTPTRFLQRDIVVWQHKNYNPEKPFFFHHSNPNNDRQSSCKNIQVDIDIPSADEAYIE